ncbi:hypothetical protein GGI07_002868 [Coemansia sp. Benny D115]|nr:hypothetical protein GGI07_002868 [Coemansia sp. Benny D115]
MPFAEPLPTHLLSSGTSYLASCRSVDDCYERLNKIEEGTYGVVYRARDIQTQGIVALKKLKLDQERNGDLKTSNLLIESGGALRVADFGLARKYSSPLGPMTGLVVTLWYRAPELLLGAKEYSTAVDMWSVGCIFAELFLHKPFLQGRGEIDQISKIFAALGPPTLDTWPGFDQLPNARMFKFSQRPDTALHHSLKARLRDCQGVTANAMDLLRSMLALDPSQRITAQQALDHPYFTEAPPPKDPSMFPTWPPAQQTGGSSGL